MFANWGPSEVVTSIPQDQVFALYQRAIFVPTGNDNSGIGMDVSRIQEVTLFHVACHVVISCFFFVGNSGRCHPCCNWFEEVSSLAI